MISLLDLIVGLIFGGVGGIVTGMFFSDFAWRKKAETGWQMGSGKKRYLVLETTGYDVHQVLAVKRRHHSVGKV